MTEFTAEFIAEQRNFSRKLFSQSVATNLERIAGQKLFKALDHIERQAARIAELEQELNFLQEKRNENKYC